MQQQETELSSYLLGEVSNKKSNDYLQTFYFTHKCTDGANVTWYKANTDYTVENTTALWFKENELEIEEEYYE